MPELAEVEFSRKQWDPAIGQLVRLIHLPPTARVFRDADPGTIASALPGARFEASVAHGKQLLFRFSGNRFLGLHLGMAGKLLTAAPEIVPSRHEHLVLVLESTALVFSDYRMFGKVVYWGQAPTGKSKRQASMDKGQALTNCSPLPPWWRDLPPQPQDPGFDQQRLREILKRRRRTPLKALLLVQDCFPGIGNWMADEILWRARIHPAAKADFLSPAKRKQLFNHLKAVCEDALQVIGTDWGDPPDDWLFNHRWKPGGTCPVSGKPLERITVGGRTTCFSPAIQRVPSGQI